MSDHDAALIESRSRRISAIWILPAVAVVLGAWMVIYGYFAEGPVIEIRLDVATGIEAGKTKLRALDVEVGLVESVRFTDDFDGVVIGAKIEKFAEPLLREDTQFWVVRPRIGAGGVSGLSTIVSGAYIELAPGSGPPGGSSYQALSEQPVRPLGAPGLHLTLASERSGSVSTGDTVTYQGMPVGKVEHVTLDLEQGGVRYSVFIEAPYDVLVTTATRFWNASGFSFNASAAGVSFGTESLQSLIAGGVAFDLPAGIEPGARVPAGTEFQLHPNRQSIDLTPYAHYAEFVVSFSQSLRGLVPGAPVEIRGIRVGTVDRILLEERAQLIDGRGAAYPVLIRFEPGRIKLGDSPEGVARVQDLMPRAVANGMRASLQSGNLLTGSLVVALDWHADSEEAAIGEFAGYTELPTQAGGLQHIEQQIATLLDKVNRLPLDSIAGSLNASLDRLEGTLAAATATLEGATRVLDRESTQELPLELTATLAELREVLSGYSADSPLYTDLQGAASEAQNVLTSFEALARTLDAKPNAVIFGRRAEADPEPKGAR